MDFLNMNLNEDENGESFSDWLERANKYMDQIDKNRKINKINEILNSNKIKNIK